MDINTLGPFTCSLGLEFEVATGDEVVAHWMATPDLHQPDGIVHGGVHCSVVETLASVGAVTWFANRGRVVGVANQTDFYRAMSHGRLTSRAIPVHRGRLHQVWAVETTDADGRLVSRGQVRLQNLPQSSAD